MDCMKCGRKTQDNNVFCPDCLADMEKHPVRQDTPVILPQRKNSPRKTPQKKNVKAEEQIAQLQLKLKRLWVAIAVLSVLLTAALGGLAVSVYQLINTPDLGSNYSTFTSTEVTTESEG